MEDAPRSFPFFVPEFENPQRYLFVFRADGLEIRTTTDQANNPDPRLTAEEIELIKTNFKPPKLWL